VAPCHNMRTDRRTSLEVDLREGYLRFPELGFTKGARLVIQPSPQGLLTPERCSAWWLRGSDLNRRPLGYEPQQGRDRHQLPSSNSKENAASRPTMFGPSWGSSGGLQAQNKHTLRAGGSTRSEPRPQDGLTDLRGHGLVSRLQIDRAVRPRATHNSTLDGWATDPTVARKSASCWRSTTRVLALCSCVEVA